MDTIWIIPPIKTKFKESNTMKVKTIISRVLFALGLIVVGSGVLEAVVLKLMEVIGW